MNRALLLDRDGVINVDRGYAYRTEHIEYVEGIFEVCHWFQRHGFRLIVITNQAGIARGYYTEHDVETLNRWFHGEFAGRGLTLDRVYFCPHHPDAGQFPYNVRCACRKPEPGMILRAQDDFDLDLSRSVLIGDKETDIEAGIRAGVQLTVRLQSPAEPDSGKAGLVVQRLAQLLEAPALNILQSHAA